MAEQLLAGDAEAVAAGFEAAADAEALGATVAMAQTALERLAAAKQGLRLAQRDLAGLRNQAKKLISRVISDLRYSLRDESAGLRREVMRTYGVRFENVEVASAPVQVPAPGAPPILAAAD